MLTSSCTGALCRQSKAVAHLSSIPDFSSRVSPDVLFCRGMLSYRVYSWSWSPRRPHCTWSPELMGHRVRCCCVFTLQHQRTYVSTTQGKMKDAIFLSSLLTVPCLNHYLGKRETQESPLFHGGPEAHCFPGKGEFTPILYRNGNDSVPASSKRLKQLSASVPKGSICVGVWWGSWLHAGA